MKFRNDLTLWKAFAEIEWLSGNTDEARRVFHSTLMMGSELFSDEHSRRTALAPLVRFYQLFILVLKVNMCGMSDSLVVSMLDLGLSKFGFKPWPGSLWLCLASLNSHTVYESVTTNL